MSRLLLEMSGSNANSGAQPWPRAGGMPGSPLSGRKSQGRHREDSQRVDPVLNLVYIFFDSSLKSGNDLIVERSLHFSVIKWG